MLVYDLMLMLLLFLIIWFFHHIALSLSHTSSSLNCPSNTKFLHFIPYKCIYSHHFHFIHLLVRSFVYTPTFTHTQQAFKLYSVRMTWANALYDRFIIKSTEQITQATNLVCIATVELDTLIATHSSLTVNSHTIFNFTLRFVNLISYYR